MFIIRKVYTHALVYTIFYLLALFLHLSLTKSLRNKNKKLTKCKISKKVYKKVVIDTNYSIKLHTMASLSITITNYYIFS